jgi:hypothetical protein
MDFIGAGLILFCIVLPAEIQIGTLVCKAGVLSIAQHGSVLTYFVTRIFNSKTWQESYLTNIAISVS